MLRGTDNFYFILITFSFKLERHSLKADRVVLLAEAAEQVNHAT